MFGHMFVSTPLRVGGFNFSLSTILFLSMFSSLCITISAVWW